MPLSRLEAAAHTVSDKTLTDVVFFSQVVLLVTQQKHNITFQIVLYTGGHLRVFQGAEVKSKLLPLLPLNLKRNTSHAVTCAMRQTHMSAHAHSGQAVYRGRTEYSPNILPIRSDTHRYLNHTLHDTWNTALLWQQKLVLMLTAHTTQNPLIKGSADTNASQKDIQKCHVPTL